MVEKGNISEYRTRLNQTLSCDDLVNKEVLKGLVRNQILRSSNLEIQESIDNIVNRRTEELTNSLAMLRSASLADPSQGGWKVKQDTEEYRVMYREGPEGAPFHTLLVEGYVDGPLDVCTCISLEADLFKKWWPHTTIPPFKVAYSQCVQKVRIGEQIALVRLKLPWPLSTREALVHFFEFDYFEDGLIIVLLNTISDLENVDASTHGFSRDGIPEADGVVRIDVVGGLAMKKITDSRSYFRTIANLDVKLDFIPPAVINFVSRQLVGSGFKLYKKEVASVSKGDEDFSKVLNGAVYNRIREALYSDGESIVEEKNEDGRTNEDEQTNVTNENDVEEGNARLCSKEKTFGEIEEIEEDDEKTETVIDDVRRQDSPRNQIVEKEDSIARDKKIVISPEVEQALATLEKAISFIRENGCGSNIKSMCKTDVENSPKDSKLSGINQISGSSDVATTIQISKKESTQTTSYEHRISSSSSRRTSSSLCPRETGHNKIAPASPDPSESYHVDSHSQEDHKATDTILEHITKNDNSTANNVDSIKEDRTGKRKTRKLSYCCHTFTF